MLLFVVEQEFLTRETTEDTSESHQVQVRVEGSPYVVMNIEVF